MINNTKKHKRDHFIRSRRHFLMTGGLAAAGSLLLGRTPVSAAGVSRLTEGLTEADSDRILVFVNLFGGNDGLNMVIPHSEAAGRGVYENLRPTLKQMHNTHYSDNTLLSGFGEVNYALPNTMQPLMDLWNGNSMSIVQNVGYPEQNFSHFLSTQLWQSGADNVFDDRYHSGVIGRQAEYEFPAFSSAPPIIPPAIQIGNVRNHIFQGNDTGMGLVFSSPDKFYELASTGNLYPITGFTDCPQDDSLLYLREAANNANRYSQVIIDAYNNSGSSNVDFPAETTNNSRMNEQLAIISRLIRGNLGTKVYLANAQKYDTHSNQTGVHTGLLQDMATSLRAFYDDLTEDYRDKVTIVVFSEFGRTIAENGSGNSAGTDHGSLAPVMLFGDGINGGFYGQPIDLVTEGKVLNGRVKYETQPATDFRSIYATLLQDWLCVPPLAVNYIMGANFPRIPDLIIEPCTASADFDAVVLLGHHPSHTIPGEISIKYGLLQSGLIRLTIMNTAGQVLATPIHEERPAGSHTFSLLPSDYLLSSGEYMYRLEAFGKEYLQRLVIN